MTTPIRFRKYDEMGAYHWIECDPHSRQYNPPLEARYHVLAKRVKPVKTLLDIGCGDGYLMGLLGSQCETVVGIDSEFTAVAYAAARLQSFPNCVPLQGNSNSLPFADSSFDIVSLADVIEHLEQPLACLQEIRRILKPTGFLLLTTPKWRSDRKWDERHVKEYTPEELIACLRPYFDDIEMNYFWPNRWSHRYSTRVGWHLLKYVARYLFNPFLKESTSKPEQYGQMLAVCH